MKLGSQTGSVMNHIYSRMTKGQPEPVVGMGATILSWTDRHAATIIEVGTADKAGKIPLITVQHDHYKRVDSGGPFTESQTYEYSPDPNGHKLHFRFRNEKWEEIRKNDSGRWVKCDGGGYGLRIGERQEYRDPHF